MILNIGRANSRIKELEAELAAAAGALEASAAHVETIADLRANLDASDANIAELKEQNEAFAKAVTEAAENLKARDEQIAALQGEVEKLNADFQTAEAQAADIVAAQGLSADAITGGSGQPAPVDHLAEYNAISDPVERGRYRAAHLKELSALAHN